MKPTLAAVDSSGSIAPGFTLPGGLPVLVRPRSGPAILAARLAIRGGSSSDPQGQRGAHQLLAGVMTRGCGTLNAEALADLVEGAGAGLRAEAHEDSLVVGLKCAADDAPQLLPLLLALVRRPRLEPEQVAIERQLNLQTLQRQREDPFQLAHDQLLRLLYGSGPYGHDPLGVEAELRDLTADHLLPLARSQGHQGAVLVLCGSVPPTLAELLLEQLEGESWSTSQPDATAPTASGASDPRQPEDLAEREIDTEQLVLMLGCPTVPLGHPDALALRLLQTHLGMGMSSRLFVVMREERGLAYDVGVSLPARRGASPFMLHLATSEERAAEATSCLLEEWQRLLEVPLSPEEMALARAKYLGQDALGRQTCSQIADRLALVRSHGLPEDHVERCLERASRLEGADLLAAARRWLGRPLLSLVGPKQGLRHAAATWRAAGLSRPLSPGGAA